MPTNENVVVDHHMQINQPDNLFAQRKLTTTEKLLERRFFISLFLILFFCFISIRFLDQPLAFFVSFLHHDGWELYNTDSFNVLITELVYFFSLITMTIYVVCRFFKIQNDFIFFSGVLSLAVAISFFIKTQLQFLFGRVAPCFETFSPVYIPRQNMFYGFKWMAEGSFPSGHMSIFGCLLALISLYYPKTRSTCISLLIILALLLIFDNYHYLSDVISGTYLGIWMAIIIKYIFGLSYPRTKH